MFKIFNEVSELETTFHLDGQVEEKDLSIVLEQETIERQAMLFRTTGNDQRCSWE